MGRPVAGYVPADQRTGNFHKTRPVRLQNTVSGESLTANEARALAVDLIAAADEADERGDPGLGAIIAAVQRGEADASARANPFLGAELNEAAGRDALDERGFAEAARRRGD